MLAYWVGLGTSMHSCSVICGSSLSNEDRATAMSVCESLAAGLLGMLGPMVGAFLVIPVAAGLIVGEALTMLTIVAIDLAKTFGGG